MDYKKALTTSYIFASQLGGKTKKKWTTLEHNGVKFPPEYVPHGVPIIYNGNKIILDSGSEELATLYSKFIMSEYVKNSTFKKNFWNDWKKMLGQDHVIKDLANCDFTLVYDHLLEIKENKKKIIKEKNSSNPDPDLIYKTAIVDGKVQNVGNYAVEPPGIFLGRGCNKNLGRVKKRIYPQDITINIGKGAKIPKPSVKGDWGSIVHNQQAEWLASWKDNITNKIKYVWLSAHSDFKTNSDVKKFDLARKLKKKIKLIRSDNETALKSSDNKISQVATALYFIDNYALRVGNEKGDDTETFGITSLLVKHIGLLNNNKIRLDFLGKDSIRYDRVLELDPIVYSNIEKFMLNKEPSDQIFDLITAGDVNKYLQQFMKGLTAKVFRTYNASNLFQKELNKISNKFNSYTNDDKINLLLDEFNKANAKVALLCNHQKNVTKSNIKRIDNLNEQIKKTKTQIRSASKAKTKNPDKISKLKEKLKKLKAKKEMVIELKNISLETSRANYIDPRITIAFLKKNNIPIEKLFSKTLIEKFKWAFDVDSTYKF